MLQGETARDASRWPRGTAAALGVVALALWAAWWAGSRWDGQFRGWRFVWFPALDLLGADFLVHIDHSARVWASGGDPYRAGDEVCSILPYPPMVPRLFGWVALTNVWAARDIWLVALTGILSIGAIEACRTRRALGLMPIPATLAVAAILFSTPALFALERGQCDGLVIPLLIASAALLKRRTNRGDIAAGAIIALAAWIKYYPGLAIVGLIGLRRWRAVGSCVVVGLLMGGYDSRGVLRSLENCKFVVAQFAPGRTVVGTTDHSLSYAWPNLWRWTILKALGRIPGQAAALLVLGPIVVLVTRRTLSIPREAASPIALPLMTWLVAVATFFPPIANDYNLIFLPLAAVAVYDPRDRPAVHLLAAYLLLWWQPLKLPIGGGVMLACKVAGVWAVGLSLMARCRELAATPRPPIAAPHGSRAARALELYRTTRPRT